MNRDWAYEDIVHLPHRVSATRPQMDLQKRAAQFAPFAALTGYDAAIAEAARRGAEPGRSQTEGSFSGKGT